MDLASRVEGMLFFKSEPMTIGNLALILEVSEEDILNALITLDEALKTRGIVLVRDGATVALMTSPALSSAIEKIKKEELKRDIGKAGAETLAIIAYHDTITRTEIDYIRGVNSTFILRNLLMRGLIERISDMQGYRSYTYRPTIELYAHLGITKKEELPSYQEIRDAIHVHTVETRSEKLSEDETS